MQELCYNLWYKINEKQMILSLAGRAYVLEGTDDEKAAVLAKLSDNDYKTVEFMPVPKDIRGHFGDAVHYSALKQVGIEGFYEEIFAKIKAALLHGVPFPEDKLYYCTPMYDFGEGFVPAEIGDGFIKNRISR